MKNAIQIFLIFIFSIACNRIIKIQEPSKIKTINSPNGHIQVTFQLNQNRRPTYSVKKNDVEIIRNSDLGFVLKNYNLTNDFKVLDYKMSSMNDLWIAPWGPDEEVINNYNELIVNLKKDHEQGIRLNIIFRVFDDGVGFRYSFPEQDYLADFVVLDEKTTFRLYGDHEAWWIPANYDSYEHSTEHTKVSEIKLNDKHYKTILVDGVPRNKDAVHTPLTMRTSNGIHLSIHEASLVNYPSMTLELLPDKKGFECDLVPSPEGIKARLSAPFDTPWRTIQVSENAGGLIASNIILNLNEPSVLEDTDWIKPIKYMGIWWGIHIGKWSFAPSPNHGANTDNAFKHIDFASEHGIKRLLIEGWNKGITYFVKNDVNFKVTAENYFVPDFQSPTEDYDFDEVSKYAKEKGVELIGYHETVADATNYDYDKHMVSAMKYMKDHGVNYLKVGFVGPIIPKGEHHHGQWMVNFYQKVVEEAARQKIMLIIHEPIKPTGLRRTWPNLMTSEGVRGQEFNAWSEGNPPNHLTTIPFTRMLAGPIDYTPGIFDLEFNEQSEEFRVQNTLANQLACYVIIESPIQMAADLPENYAKHLDAFQFIKDVPVNWKKTKVINGKIGDYLTIARKDKNSDDWFLGSVNNENKRILPIPLDFLEDNVNYEATIYEDGENAHWKKNPTSFNIKKIKVNSSMNLKLKLASGGGQAIRFRKLK